LIALYIIGGIILFIAILLHCPVRAKISFIDKKFDISVKYLFFTLYPMKEKKPKKKKIKQKKKKKVQEKKEAVSEETPVCEKTEETEEKPSSEPPPIPTDKKKKEKKPKLTKEEKEERKKELQEKIELVKMILASASKGLKKLLSAIRLYDIAIDIDVANEDASKLR